MLPASTWPAIDNAALALLSLVVSALLAALVPMVLRWLNAHVSLLKDTTARAAAQTIVAGIQQTMTTAIGADKKSLALGLLTKQCPWLPPSVASTLIESSVLALHQAIDNYQIPAPATTQTNANSTAAPPAKVIITPPTEPPQV